MTAIGSLIQKGTHGGRPAAGIAGQIYYETDTLGLFRDSGAAWDAINATQLDYVEFTSNVSPTATTEATANTVVTGTAVTYDGNTAVMIEFYTPACRPDVASAGRTLSFYLYDGSSSIGLIGLIGNGSTNTEYAVVHCLRRLTPSNAAHTYSIRASVSAGTGIVGAGAGGNGNTMPGFIRIARAL